MGRIEGWVFIDGEPLDAWTTIACVGRLYVLALAPLLAVLTMLSCSATPPAVTAATLDTIGRTSHALGPVLVAAYEHDPRPTAAVDATYAPVWTAWHALEVAQASCAATVEAGGQCDAAAVVAAFCAMARVIPAGVAVDVAAVAMTACAGPEVAK